MKKSKGSEPQGTDRLSELPDSVIFHILWFVPMSDAIRTSVLSKRWRNLWTLIPSLNFVNVNGEGGNSDYYYDEDDSDQLKSIEDNTNQFRNHVNRALLWWDGERILKFKVDSSHKLDRSIHDDIDAWLRVAQKNEVEELYLHLHCARIYSVVIDDAYVHHLVDAYWVPQFLYSCSSLKKLSLRQCSFDINKNVQWNKLKSLTITESFRVTGSFVTKILSGTPQLEVFILSFADRGESLSIQSRSLKELSIYKFLYERDHLHEYEDEYGELQMVTKLRIKTPNLESLTIKGIPYGEYSLVDVSSLTHATIGFSGMHFFDEDNDRDLTSTDFLGETYNRILPNILHAKHVTLSYCCIKHPSSYRKLTVVPGAWSYEKEMYLPSYPNVKSLQIGYRFNDYMELVVLLESFPQLETLVLQDRVEDERHYEVGFLKLDLKISCDATLSRSFLLQLRTVEVTWAEGDHIFPFIETVLKYASKLEKMIFRVKEIQPPYSPSYSSSPSPSSNPLVLASQKLLKMPRASPNCTIDVLVLASQKLLKMPRASPNCTMDVVI